MFSFKYHLRLLALLLTFLITGQAYAAQADNAPLSAKVKESMKFMKGWGKMMGPPRLDGQELFLGNYHVNVDFYIVDAMSKRFGGTATIFAKKGDGFIRISTNVIKDGNRAVGTMLDPAGPVITLIKQGKPFYGTVDILGKKYETGYEPIFTANGDVIGIYYVGYLIE